MIDHYKGCFLRRDVDDDLKKFFSSVFLSFKEEINHLADSLYVNKDQKFYKYIERTWVGVFNDAVKRSFPGAATLQEFSVQLDRIGRADYFVRLPDKKIDLLFEAKANIDNGSWDYSSMGNWYDRIILQADSYYRAEMNDYLDKTYLVALIFGWLPNAATVETAKRYMDLTDEEKEEKDPCDFCALFLSEEHGLWVYGKLKRA